MRSMWSYRLKVALFLITSLALVGVLYTVGQGIETKKDDLAEEVAKLTDGVS